MAINNARNAGLLAARILGASDPHVRARVAALRESSEASVREKARRLEADGWKAYLEHRGRE